MEPVLDGIQLRRVGWQKENVHVVLVCQVQCLLLVVDRAVVQDEPPLSSVLMVPALVDLDEHLLDEV